MLALYALLMATGGCYRLSIGNGSFRCAAPGNLCPEGYECGPDGTCTLPVSGARDGGAFDIYSGRLGAKNLTGMTGKLECSTRTGAIRLIQGGATTEVVAAGASGFTYYAQPSGGPAVAVWSFSSLVLPATLTSIEPTSDSDRILVFVSTGELTVRAPMNWRGFGGFGGLHDEPGQAASSGIDSGGRGGPIAGGGGGGGGGHASPGKPGGGVLGGAGGARYGSEELVPVHLGSGGGGGGGGSGGAGGNGGGAVVLIGRSITLSSTIDVSGLDGVLAATPSTSGGGGGGSGGSILLSGDTVTLETGHGFLAQGGRGGAGAAGAGDGGAAATSDGGDGAEGRIVIAGRISVPGAVSTMPNALQGIAPLATFPR